MINSAPKRLKYFKHIDGLRAMAVLSVVFYHFGFTTLSGGYVGVDVFFVISGYLITRIIFSEIEKTGGFSYLNFYKRRVLRLFPALFFTLFGCTVASLILFTPENLAQFASSLSATALSVSNILFWNESGYFDTASHLKPLLHTWSLSVEEQFYLFWPITVVLLSKIKSFKNRVIVIAIIGLISYMMNYFWVSGNFDIVFKSTIFFLTPFRIFEFIIGAIGAVFEKKIPKNVILHELMMMLGIFLIGYSIFNLTDKSIFPYYNAVMPCLGALLVILSCKSRYAGFFLTNRISVGIGLISYSLYLVHWPLLVFNEYYYFNVVSKQANAYIIIAAAFAIAIFMYFYIEQPFRTKTGTARTKFFKIWIGSMIFVSIFGIAISHFEGLLWNYSFKPLSLREIDAGKQRRYFNFLRGCNILLLNNPSACHMERPIQMLFFGNSHETDGLNAFSFIYKESNLVNLISFGSVNDCGYNIIGNKFMATTKTAKCEERLSVLNNSDFLSKINYVVYSSSNPFDEQTRDMWKALETFKITNSKIKLIVLGGYLVLNNECASIYNRTGSFNNCRDRRFLVDGPNFDEKIRSPIPQSKYLRYLYINKYLMLCHNGKLSSCEVEGNGEPMFYDQHHLSFGFANLIGKLILKNYVSDLQEIGLPIPLRDN
jgi:peptidoglycan/LPS O-acetylase OafA/YrhL